MHAKNAHAYDYKKEQHHDKHAGHEGEEKNHNKIDDGEEKKLCANLTKKNLKMIEKLHAKIEYHEIRDEYDEANKLREQITAIEDNANAHALKKAQKSAV
jgi:tRNA U34 5-carboxymethylaminomethyl modifying GTPase MnmE/TrmE